MRVFHGSYASVCCPEVGRGRSRVDCRKGGSLQFQYDVVEGGVANDNVIDTVELYENGDITAEQALGQLAYKKVNHQIAILRQGIVEGCLRYIGSEEVRHA